METVHLALASATTKLEDYAADDVLIQLDRYSQLVVTLDVTAAEQDDLDETFDFYVTTGDGVTAWDLVHFPQITAAGRYTARIVSLARPENVTTASPGVAANDSATLLTTAAGAGAGIMTLGAGVVRHGKWGDRIGYQLDVEGTVTVGVTYSLLVQGRG